MEEQYYINKSAKVGDEIRCPVCGHTFSKRQYSQAFCCGKCKDTYWNENNGSRRVVNLSEFNQGWWNCFVSFALESIDDNELLSVLVGAGVKQKEVEAFEKYTTNSGEYYPARVRNIIEVYKHKISKQ